MAEFAELPSGCLSMAMPKVVLPSPISGPTWGNSGTPDRTGGIPPTGYATVHLLRSRRRISCFH